MEKEPYQFRRQRDKKPDSIDEATLQEIDADARRSIMPHDPHAQRTKLSLTKKRIILVSVLVLGVSLLMIAMIAGFFLSQPPKSIKSITSSKETKQTSSKKKVDNTPLGKFITPQTGEKWYAKPKALESQGWIVDPAIDFAEYYEVGTRGKNTIIAVHIGSLGSNDSKIYQNTQLFEQSQDGIVTHISNPGAYPYYAQPNIVRSDILSGLGIYYDSLTLPTELTIDGVQPSFNFTSGKMLKSPSKSDYTTKEEVKKLGSSTLVKYEKVCSDIGLTTFVYAVDLPIGSSYVLQDSDRGASMAYWACGNSLGQVFGNGPATSYRIDNANDDMFIKQGITTSGEDWYQFKDSNHPLVVKAYETYVEFQEKIRAQYTAESNVPPMKSKEDFLKDGSVFAIKTKQGEWLLDSKQITP